MGQESDQLVFLVGLEHDVGHGSGRSGDADLEEEESSLELFECSVDTASVVVVKQKVHCIELAILLADQGNVRIYSTTIQCHEY